MLVSTYDKTDRLREPLRKLYEATAKGPYEFKLYENFLSEYRYEQSDKIQDEEKERINQAIDECKNIQANEYNMK